MPLPYWMNKATLDRIREWVEHGGHLISECFFGGLEADSGLHSTVTPGYGFDEVFGVREALTYPASRGFNSYTWSAEEDGCELWMEMACDCGRRLQLSKFNGHTALTTLVPTRDVETLACLPDGTPGITRASYGKGTATMIGTLLGASYAINGDDRCADLLADIVDLCEPDPRPQVEPYGQVRVDVLSDGKKRWMLVHSLTDKAVKASIKLPFEWSGKVREMLSSGAIACVDGVIHVDLAPGHVQAYWLE